MSNGPARRTVLLAGAAAAIALRVAAEEPAQPKRIGILAAAAAQPIDSFRERLRELGWREGQNVEFAYRWAEGGETRFPAIQVGTLPGFRHAGRVRPQSHDFCCETRPRCSPTLFAGARSAHSSGSTTSARLSSASRLSGAPSAPTCNKRSYRSGS